MRLQSTKNCGSRLIKVTYLPVLLAVGLIGGNSVSVKATESWFAGTVFVVNATPYTLYEVEVFPLFANGSPGNPCGVGTEVLGPGEIGSASGCYTGDSDQVPGGEYPNGNFGVSMYARCSAVIPGVGLTFFYSSNILPIANHTPSCSGTLYCFYPQTSLAAPDDNSDGAPSAVRPNDNSPCGMPMWSVSEPYISLWLHDEPLGYQPAIGPRISFELAFKQRESTAGYNTNFFSTGINWNCSWLSFVTRDWNSNNVVNFPGGGQRTYYTPNDYLTDTSLAGDTTNGFTLSYPDGSKDVYEFVVTNASGVFLEAFLTQHLNPQAQKTTFNYYSYTPNTPDSVVIRLKNVVDGDGRTNYIYYNTTNVYSTNLISRVVDPFGRGASLAYDTNGCLTNITDVVTNSSSIAYDTNNWVTSITTPYGITSFTITDSGTNLPPNGRSVLVTQPDGGHQLFLYQDYALGVTNTYPTVPSTSPFANTLDNSDLNLRNTFYWGPRQYVNLSTTNIAALTNADFRLARMQHWLLSTTNNIIGETLSLERDPSPDTAGTIEGQKTWYDYAGKTNTEYEGTQVEPLFVAQVLPDSTTRFTYSLRNSLGAVTTNISTYSAGFRINIYVYAPNQVDLLIATNALGFQVSSNSYNGYHEVTTNYDALNEETVYTYNANQQLSSVTLPNSLVTTYAYGADNFVAQQINSGFATNSYTYTNDLVLTHTDARGLVTTNTWDNLNRLTKTAFPDSTFISNTYNKLDLVQTVDRMGFTNSFGYDSMRRMVTATNALGTITAYDYCECGELNSITNALGTSVQAVTQFSYDNQGNLTNSIYADNYSLTNTYNLLRQVVSTADSGGNNVTNTYNNQGLLTAVNNAFGQLQSMTYDILDRATTNVDVNGVSVVTTYDNLNRPLARSYPDNGVEHWGYTANVSGPTSYTNQTNNVVTYNYDNLSRKINEVYMGVTTNGYTYDGASDLLTLTDGKNQTTTWTYDAYGNVSNKVDAASNLIFVYKYDGNNRLTTRWSIAKGTTTYKYDAAGNLTNIVYPVSPAITLAYDMLNRMTSMADAVGTTAYSYDSVGQLLSEDGPWANDTVSYTYLNRLRQTLGLQAPSGSAWSQSYGYDSARRLTSVGSPAGNFGYAYPSANFQLPSAISLPNGAYITNSFDSVARLLSTKLLNSSATVLDSESYAYNQASQRTAETNTAGDFRNYTYDNAGELTTAIGKAAGGTTNRWQEQLGYAYDAAGNLNYRTNNGLLGAFSVNNLNELTTVTNGGRLTVAGTTTTPATSVTVNTSNAVLYADATFASTNQPWTNGNNSYTAVGQDSYGRVSSNSVTVNLQATNSYAYDLNGNLLSDTNRNFAYDDENQLTSVWATNIWRDDFVYDGKFRRKIERDYSWNGGSWMLTNEVHFIYDGNVVIQERDANSNPLVTYTRSGGSLLARTDYGQEIPGSPTTAFYHADGNGNVTMLIYANQIIAAKYLYDPYGNALSMSGPLASLNVYRFASKEWNSSAGIYYLGRRYYDPSLQRFINRDPIAEQGGINLYAYVANNPINAIDLLGLELLWQSSSYGNPVSSTLSGLSGTWASNPYGSGGANYSNGGLYQPDAIPPMDPVSKNALLFLATAPVALVGSEVIASAYAAEEIGIGGMLWYNAAWGSSVSVANNTASQLIENGGNLAAVNSRQQMFIGAAGGIFGFTAGGLGFLSDSLAENAFAQTVQIQSQASYALSLGRYEGVTLAEEDAILAEADANTAQVEFWSQLQVGALNGLDIYGLPLAEYYVDEQLMAALGLKPPCH
jgi:RHS repeat-associated protein